MTMVIIPRRRTGTDCRRRRLRLCRAPALLCSGAPVRLLPPRSRLHSSVQLCRASSCSTLFLCACAPVLQLVLLCSCLLSCALVCSSCLTLLLLCSQLCFTPVFNFFLRACHTSIQSRHQTLISSQFTNFYPESSLQPYLQLLPLNRTPFTLYKNGCSAS